jgi:hypothetical protein
VPGNVATTKTEPLGPGLEEVADPDRRYYRVPRPSAGTSRRRAERMAKRDGVQMLTGTDWVGYAPDGPRV